MERPLNPFGLLSTPFWDETQTRLAKSWAKDLATELNLPEFRVLSFCTEQDEQIAKLHNTNPKDDELLDFFFEEDVDKFTNEVKVSTNHSRCFEFPHEFPLDFLFISEPEGDKYYILFTQSDLFESSGSMIINIDEKTNLKLKAEKIETYKICNLWKKRTDDECRVFFPITKDNLLKCCMSKELSVRVCKDKRSPVAFEEFCDELIPCFQLFYNRVCDNSMYAERIEDLKQWLHNQYKKQLVDSINQSKKIEKETDSSIRQDDMKYYLKVAAAIGIGIALLITIGLLC